MIVILTKVESLLFENILFAAAPAAARWYTLASLLDYYDYFHINEEIFSAVLRKLIINMNYNSLSPQQFFYSWH
jgi:hypothetical protein